MHFATGQKPLRTVIFAFWDGEEKGLLGSKYFVQSCPFISQVKGYLNFDMIGRNNKPEQPQHVVYFTPPPTRIRRLAEAGHCTLQLAPATGLPRLGPPPGGK